MFSFDLTLHVDKHLPSSDSHRRRLLVRALQLSHRRDDVGLGFLGQHRRHHRVQLWVRRLHQRAVAGSAFLNGGVAFPTRPVHWQHLLTGNTGDRVSFNYSPAKSLWSPGTPKLS